MHLGLNSKLWLPRVNPHNSRQRITVRGLRGQKGPGDLGVWLGQKALIGHSELCTGASEGSHFGSEG